MRRALLLAVLACCFAIPSHAQDTFRASITGLSSAASATDIFTIKGSATKGVYITKVEITCNQTTAGAIDVQLIKRSTADTSGTSTNPTAVEIDDQQSISATATLNAYTANPTTGTLVGTIGSFKLGCMASSTASPQDIVVENFVSPQQPVLRGTAEQFAINLNGVTVTGGSFDITVEWRER